MNQVWILCWGGLDVVWEYWVWSPLVVAGWQVQLEPEVLLLLLLPGIPRFVYCAQLTKRGWTYRTRVRVFVLVRLVRLIAFSVTDHLLHRFRLFAFCGFFFLVRVIYPGISLLISCLILSFESFLYVSS